MSKIVSFYTGAARDEYGRTIDTIGAFDDDRLEDIHNYIQLLFPLETPSQFVNAPLLDAETVRAFNERQRSGTGNARCADLASHAAGSFSYDDPDSAPVSGH